MSTLLQRERENVFLEHLTAQSRHTFTSKSLEYARDRPSGFKGAFHNPGPAWESKERSEADFQKNRKSVGTSEEAYWASRDKAMFVREGNLLDKRRGFTVCLQ